MQTTQSAEIDQLATALCKAQAAMPAVEKDSENPAFKRNGKPTKYSSLGAVHDAVREVLSKNGLCVAQTGAVLPGGGIGVETTLMHISGQWIRGCLPMTPEKATPQAIGGAVTYGRRYGLCAMVGLVADEDDDGNAASGKTHPSAPSHAPTRANAGRSKPPTPATPPAPSQVPVAKMREYLSDDKTISEELWGDICLEVSAPTDLNLTDWPDEMVQKAYSFALDRKAKQVPPKQAEGAYTACPDCGGEVWDNRAQRKQDLAEKAAGTRTKGARPAWACKDKTGCKWTQWESGDGDDQPKAADGTVIDADIPF